MDAQESYCVAYKNHSSQAGNIGQATAFVSHAWGHEFLDVVAALEAYQSTQSETVFFWFDIFSNNQHKTSVRDFTWWQTVFRDNIGSLKRTLLVLEWKDPKPLTRAWCLWEMVSTVNTKSHFQVLMSPKNHSSFVTALVDDFESIVLKTCNVDLRHAKAFKEDDEANIKKAVEETAGFAEVNKVIIGIMREWMVQSGKAVLSSFPEQDRPGSTLQLYLGRLLQDLGELGEAERLCREALAVSRGTPGTPGMYAKVSNLAEVLRDQGKFEEAESLHREALIGRQRLLGNTHSSTLLSLNNLGLLLQYQGRLSEAEPYLRESYEAERLEN